MTTEINDVTPDKSPQNEGLEAPSDYVARRIKRPCPDHAGVIISGRFYPCDFMDHIHPDGVSHVGWAHSNSEAEALWSGGDQ